MVLYIIRTRNFNRQIKVLTNSAFGSTSTDLNKNFKTLPNTNMFANEKSNPVMNSNISKNLDTQSILSSDSDDFAGLHDNPIFNVSGRVEDNFDDVKSPFEKTTPKPMKMMTENGSSYI